MSETSEKDTDLNTYVVIDTETTGLNPDTCKVIELAAIKYENGNETDRFSTFVNPKEKVSDFISHLTHISNEELENAPFMEDVIKDYVDFLGDNVLVGHNVRFDIRFINASLRAAGMDEISPKFIDTCEMAWGLFKKPTDVENYKQTTIAAFLGYDTAGSHRAINDSEICGCIYKDMREKMSKEKSENEIYKHVKHL